MLARLLPLRSLLLLSLATTALACGDEATPDEVEPGVVDDGKSDFTSNTMTRIVGSIDTTGETVRSKVTSPFRFHGYTFVAEPGMTFDLTVATAKRGKFYVYGPAHRFDNDGTPRFGQETFKVETVADYKPATRSLSITEAGVYLVVIGPRLALSTDYEVTLDCSAGCDEPTPAATIDQLVGAFGKGLKLDDYVHPQWGVHVIHRPGAIDAVKRYDHFADFLAEQPGRAELGEAIVASMSEAAFPAFDCENGFAKDGAFIERVASFNRLASLMTTLNEVFEDEIYDAASVARAGEVDALVDVQALTTDDGVMYYFAEIDGLWFLLAIDLDSNSCSA